MAAIGAVACVIPVGPKATHDAGPADAGDGSGPQCQTKCDCPTGEVCEAGICQDPTGSCRYDSDCPADQLCNSSTNACAAGCSSAFACDCPNNQVCDDATATCGACSSADPCASGEMCVGGTCEPGCVSAANCDPGEICVVGTCAPCQMDEDCTGTYGQNSRCVDGLCGTPASDAGVESDAGEEPDSGVPPVDGGLPPADAGIGMPCQSKYDCPAGDVCTHSLCTVPVTSCSSNSGCPVGQICQNGTQCVTGCSDQRDCPSGDTCDVATSMCMGPPACNMTTCQAACTTGQACDPATCTCLASPPPSCTANSDCAANNVCNNGTCAPEAVDSSGMACTLLACLLGSYGLGTPCVAPNSTTACTCQSTFANGFGTVNYAGPFPCM